MRVPDDDPERIDINLDEEPLGESPLADAGMIDNPNAREGGAGAAAARESNPALITQLAKLQAEKDELFQTMVRRQADFENFRKRVEKERQQDTARATTILVEGLLPVLDAFERAVGTAVEDPGLEQYRKGFELIYKQLWDSLARLGLERIEAVSAQFDPFVHQAVERMETADAEEGTVLEELQRGYKVKDKVVRPAMVRVAARPRERAEESEDRN